MEYIIIENFATSIDVVMFNFCIVFANQYITLLYLHPMVE